MKQQGSSGLTFREEEMQQKVEEKIRCRQYCFLNVHVAWHETKELLWLNRIVSCLW